MVRSAAETAVVANPSSPPRESCGLDELWCYFSQVGQAYSMLNFKQRIRFSPLRLSG
jgi:hypothetical protein